MKIKKLAFLIALLMLFNVLIPVCSFAVSYYDYRQYISKLIEQYGDFETPIANFDIKVNGSEKGGTNITRGDDHVETLSQIKNSGIKIKVGDKITVSNKSTVGSGSSIILYDLQVAQGVIGDTATSFNSYSNINQVITAESPGELIIFLNVADNYNKIPAFNNFSQYGNWRTEHMKPTSDPNIQIKGSYFTAMKITVEDTAKPKAEFEIHYQGQNKTDNYLNPVELDGYPATVSLIDRSTVEKGNIIDYTWERKLPNGSWQYISNVKNPITTINENIVTFRLKVGTADGKWSDWKEHEFYSKLKGSTEPVGDIKAFLDGPAIAEWGDTIRLDSSRSASTSTIVKREYWRKTSSQSTWALQPTWENEIKPSEKTIDSGSASYIEYKLVIKDSDGRTAEDIHRVNMIESVDPEIRANLVFDPRQGFEKVKIPLEDYLNDNEIEVNYWVTAEYSSYVKTSLGHFYFFQNVDDSQIRKHADNQSAISSDPNFIDYIRLNTRVNPRAMEDAAALGTFKVRPSNPTIKAALLLKANLVNLDPDFATAYHTVEFDVDSIPPETQLNIPSPFYPKEIDNPGQKTITWTYNSEQNIPYKYSIVSLYKKDGEGYYETVFKDKIITERYLMVNGNAHEEYEIAVKVVDQLNKSSNIASGEFVIIDAVPVIDLELDNKTNPDILKIQVFNKTPEEIESLFPTSYTSWKIEDENKNIMVKGDGEAPKSIDLDYRFNRGKYTVTQYATNTLGATAHASKEFEITSILDFKAEPYVQFEDDFIKLIDLSKYITDKRWKIRESDETEFSNLHLNENNEFTRKEGIYQVKLRGAGYFEYVGEAEREIMKTIAFLSTKPKAAFILGGNLKMYKEIILDGSISEQITEARLQAKYPIDFSHENTVFEIIPMKDKDGETDPSRLEYILGHDKEVLEDRAVFKGKQLLSIRIDKEGWYKARYKVYNHRKESDWYEEEFYVSPKLSPRADISVGAPVVFRDPDKELKVKMEVILDYESLDEEIDFDKSTLFLSYSPHREGQLEQTFNMNIKKSERHLKELTSNFSDIVIDWGEKRAVFTLILDDPEKKFFGRFIFDFLAIEKEKIPNYTGVGDIPDDLSKADTSHVNEELKTILIDNNKPYIELETTKTNTVEIWIIEESDKPLDINKMLRELELNRIKAKIYLIKEDNTVEIFE